MLSVIMLSVTFHLLLCRMLICWISWYTIMGSYEVGSHLDWNIRLGWWWQTVTNTLAHYVTKLITAVKKFYCTCFWLYIKHEEKILAALSAQNCCHFLSTHVSSFSDSMPKRKLGNCDKFYFTFIIVHQNWVRIVQTIKLDQIPIHHLLN